MANDNIEINLEPTTTETNNIEINVEAGTKIPVNPADMIPAENTTKKKTNKRTIKKKDDEDESLPMTASNIPQVKSIACSTEKAIEWDETFKKNADESGRAVLGVHVSKGTKEEMKLFKE